MRETLKYIIVTMLLIGFTSCSKQEDVCGVIQGGYSEMDRFDPWPRYFFRLSTDSRVEVDELTYLSYRVGDYICLEY